MKRTIFRCGAMVGLAVSAIFLSAGSVLASGGEGAGGVNALNPLSFQTDLALWTAVVFVGLLLVLGRFAFRPIADALDAREKSMAETLAATDKANSDAKELLETYQHKLAESHHEMKQMLDAARAESQKIGEGIVQAAKAQAVEEHVKAVREIEVASTKALSELAAKSAELATSLAGKILKERINPADHSRLIEGAIREFSQN